MLCHLSQLGFRVNWEKSKFSPVQRISFLGMELDSVNMTPCLTNELAQSVHNCRSSFKGRTVVPLKQFQRLLGHMASTAVVTQLRPALVRLHNRVPRWAWLRDTHRLINTPMWAPGTVRALERTLCTHGEGSGADSVGSRNGTGSGPGTAALGGASLGMPAAVPTSWVDPSACVPVQESQGAL